MKILVVIVFMILLGSSTLIGQTTTGYVTVHWYPDLCQACCLGMEYGPCITVVRDYDKYVVVNDSCVVVSNDDHYVFTFTMPQCTSNWDYTVYAAVWAGCDGGPLCCHGKVTVHTDCSKLESGEDADVPWE
jgi:hypothetical protein